MKNDKDGNFVRRESGFRNWVTADGSAGPTGEAGFRAESGRYHLYVSLACPWAHRTLIYRKLKGLEPHVSVSVVHPVMPSESWIFGDYPGSTPDHLYGHRRMADLYRQVAPDYDGVVTVPVLFDKQRETIVNNESSEIIRMFNSAFDAFGRAEPDYYPPELREAIDLVNAEIYATVNNGVYRVGFATSQSAYEEAFGDLFTALDGLEQRLSSRRYLLGERITEADWRLLPTLLRFDPVYFGHFKCNLRRLVDYPSLWGYTRDLYQQPGIAKTVDFDHIKTHYYASHPQINPNRIVPLGPEIDFEAPHGRG